MSLRMTFIYAGILLLIMVIVPALHACGLRLLRFIESPPMTDQQFWLRRALRQDAEQRIADRID